MPKRATHTFESEKDGVQSEQLNVCFCLCCGESVCILGPKLTLASLPTRRTDGAHVLARSEATFKLKATPGSKVVIKRKDGYEPQWRLNCWNCGVPVAYSCVEGDKPDITYLLKGALGAQADLYLQIYQVPPCIQTTNDGTLRIALGVRCEQPKKAITYVNNGEVGISVIAPSRDGAGNAEALEHMAKVLGVSRKDISLSRGWSQSSKFLTVTGITAADAFKRINDAIDSDVISFAQAGHVIHTGHSGGATAHLGGDDLGPSVGAASGMARRMWEAGEELEELAEAPTKRQQTFRA